MILLKMMSFEIRINMELSRFHALYGLSLIDLEF